MTAVRGLPPALVELLHRGLWPTSGTKADARIPLEVAKAWDGHSNGVNLEQPLTLQDEIERNPSFWEEHGALKQIDPRRFVIIGDFGPGSDSPIVIDLDDNELPVLHLNWLPDGNTWNHLAQSFDSFVTTIFPNGPAAQSVFYQVRWLHDFDDEPILLTSHVDHRRAEVRKVDRYRSGWLDLAGPDIQTGSTFLSSEPFPSFAHIAEQDDFEIEEIDEATFETTWRYALANFDLGD